jgi:hypothetical protein
LHSVANRPTIDRGSDIDDFPRNFMTHGARRNDVVMAVATNFHVGTARRAIADANDDIA